MYYIAGYQSRLTAANVPTAAEPAAQFLRSPIFSDSQNTST
jgi:hypothetical protein